MSRELLHGMIATGDLAIPMPNDKLSSPRVLTMSFEEGDSIGDLAATIARCQADGVSVEDTLGYSPVDAAALVSKVFAQQM